MNIRRSALAALLLGSGLAQAQTIPPGNPLQQGQYRTGIAYRELEQARYEARLAEQDVLNLADAHKAAQQQAELRRRELDVAQKALETARARLAAAQKTYEREVNAVDAAHLDAKQVPLPGAAPAANQK